jgi:shikimate kinase
MSSSQGFIALAGRNIARAPVALAFRRLCRIVGELCVPVYAERGEEALAIFRDLGFAGMSLLERVDAPAADSMGFPPSSLDTFVSGDEGLTIGFDAANAARDLSLGECGADTPERLDASVRRAIAALEKIRARRLPVEYSQLCRELDAAERSAQADAAAGASRPRGIAFVGLMAAGKSETGRLLSLSLGWPFLDSDAMVEAEAGMSVAEIFSREGEASFRARESRALECAEAALPCVLSLGGGAVLASENRALLARSFTTVWLHVTPATAARRSTASSAPVRPLLQGGSERGGAEGGASVSAHAERTAILGGILEKRRELYAVCADLLISTEGRDPAVVAEVIRAEIDIAR